MKTFEYVAVDASGNAAAGRAFSPSELQLDRELEARGLTLTKARAVADEPRRRNVRVGRDQLIALTTQLATVHSAGVPLVQGLEGIGKRLEGDDGRLLVNDMVARLRDGAALSEVMGDHPRTFPLVYRSSVQAGEASGALDLVLSRLAKHLEWVRAMRATTLQALIYPALLGAALLGLVVILLTFVLPRIMKLFPGGRADLPSQTRVVLAVSDFFVGNALVLGVGAPLALAALVWTVRRPAGRLAFHRALLSVPKLGRVARQLATSRFASTAATLNSAGCDVFTVLGVSADTCGNAAMSAAFHRAARAIRRGATITEALEREPLCDPLLVQMVSVGEEAGDLGRCLDRLAEYYDEEVPRAVKRFLAFLEPAMLVCAGLVVTYILLASLLPIFSLYENLR